MRSPTLAVLVPVLNRPANVEPLVTSFLTGCFDNARLIFISEVGDIEEREAISRIANFTRITEVSSLDAHTWPEKTNLGVECITADWYLFGADDIRFTPGWWEATEQLRNNPAISVIGTNDQQLDGSGGNPRVQVEQLVIHPLVRATYIRDHGTIDQPGVAVHPGYSHWCCDDELLWTAKLRGAYAYCPEAHIPHMHPYFGAGEMDDVYRAGEANSEADMALWADRAVRLLGLQIQ